MQTTTQNNIKNLPKPEKIATANQILRHTKKQKTFESIVDAYSTDLYRYALWVAKDKHVAEEAIQETYLCAWKSLDNLRNIKSAKSWLLTTLRREFNSPFARKHLDMSNVGGHAEIAIANTYLDDSPEALALRRALKRLDENYREPLLMQIFYGFSCVEVADVLEITVSTVMKRTFRAREKLRKYLNTEELDFVIAN